jgi:uncharacterized membrane protein (DUF485 family)
MRTDGAEKLPGRNSPQLTRLRNKRHCQGWVESHRHARMPPSSSSHDDVVHSESFLRSLMRRQLGLSISCAATFLIALVGMPLLNYFAPELMATRIAGFTLTWLVLGVLFFPFVWIISYIFIKRSIALEEDEVAQVRAAKESR